VIPAPVRAGAAGARDAVVRATAWVAGAAFIVIFAVNLAQIALRPVSGGWVWANDLSRLLFAWMVMLGAAAAYGRYDHIVAGFLVERFSPAWQRVMAVVVRAVELLVAFVLLISGLQVAGTRMQIEYIQLGVPTGWAFLSVPVLGAIMLLLALTSPLHIPSTQEHAEREVELMHHERRTGTGEERNP
jgi:TRAP-type C4-dicarboxylate transport system permease small subunit